MMPDSNELRSIAWLAVKVLIIIVASSVAGATFLYQNF